MKPKFVYLTTAVSLLSVLLFLGATATAQGPIPPRRLRLAVLTITQTLSDGAQRNTIAFDGLAFLTGNLGADSFFRPARSLTSGAFSSCETMTPRGWGTTRLFDQSCLEHASRPDLCTARRAHHAGTKPG